MAAPTRGLLGSSSSSIITSAKISWPATTSTSASTTFSTSTSPTSTSFSGPSDTTSSKKDSERRIRGVYGSVESSYGVSASNRVQKALVCQGNSLLDGAFGASAFTAYGTSCRGISVLRVGSQVDGGHAHASMSPCSVGLLDSGSVSGALQCRSISGGLLVLPPLTHRLRSPANGFRRVKFAERNGGGVPCITMAYRRHDAAEKGKEIGEAGDMQALESEWHANLSESSPSPEVQASWEQIGMVFRVVYALAMYGGLAFAGNMLCNLTGMDLWGGFDLSPQVITTGFGYAVPPMMALLFILEDEVVKTWGPARAIRDVEDEELMDFFVGMSPWQFPFVVAAGAVAEELFFRVAVQGGLARTLQASNKGVTDTAVGLAAVTGVIPLFVPFAQIFAAALTAALTGSMYYIISSPKDPKYVVAPVVQGHNNRRDIKQRVEAWYERRQQKKIYSPLMEALLAMYLGFEWVHTGNILAPMITHTLYSIVIVGNGLRRIHDNREKLRQRVNKIAGQKLASIGVKELGSESQIKG